MRRRQFGALAIVGGLVGAGLASTATAAPIDPVGASAECAALFGVAAGPEPLSACQWDMRLMNVAPWRSHG